jgi:hypothetical protein
MKSAGKCQDFLDFALGFLDLHPGRPVSPQIDYQIDHPYEIDRDADEALRRADLPVNGKNEVQGNEDTQDHTFRLAIGENVRNILTIEGLDFSLAQMQRRLSWIEGR